MEAVCRDAWMHPLFMPLEPFMLDVPKPESRFHGAYEIALDWCDDVPQGKTHDDCVVGSMASMSVWEQVALDRATLLEGALVLALVAGAVSVTRRRFRRV
jgi:hypothetical protein